MKSRRGQILLPGLALYLGLLILFFGLVKLGRVTLTQQRMEMAAQAAALSAARAQAQMLNKCSAHNLAVNTFVNLSYHGLGAMQSGVRDPFWLWLKEETYQKRANSILNGFKGYCAAVGKTVARLNGAEDANYLPPFDIKLQFKDMEVVLLDGYIPVGEESFENVYYARNWRLDQRKAQPDHLTSWGVIKNHIRATASARVYLDIREDDELQNGGFPRPDEEWGVGDVNVQSFYPQFNARLIKRQGYEFILKRLLGRIG
jgi:hypothetical protein